MEGYKKYDKYSVFIALIMINREIERMHKIDEVDMSEIKIKIQSYLKKIPDRNRHLKIKEIVKVLSSQYPILPVFYFAPGPLLRLHTES